MEELIKAANDRLKTSNTRISIQARGGYLSLQGVFPPKPASGKSYPYQQRLTLKIPVSKKGIIAAEKQAILLRYKIDMGEFKWEQPSTAIKTIDELIRDFEADYFSGRQRNPKTLTTWQGEYIKSFNKLKGETLTPESIKEAILSTEPNSRSRKRTAICLRALGKFAGIDVNFVDKLTGTYSAVKINPRELPTDIQIAEWRDKIPNPTWRWFYGVLATYGLRPHEAFSGVTFDEHILIVGEDSKTGSRQIWPFYPEWVEHWDLPSINLPKISGKNNSALGDRSAKFFYRLGLPFKLYDLRHAWARRAYEFGLPIELAAKQMGHSRAVHSKVYSNWIDRDINQKAFELSIKKKREAGASSLAQKNTHCNNDVCGGCWGLPVMMRSLLSKLKPRPEIKAPQVCPPCSHV